MELSLLELAKRLDEKGCELSSLMDRLYRASDRQTRELLSRQIDDVHEQLHNLKEFMNTTKVTVTNI